MRARLRACVVCVRAHACVRACVRACCVCVCGCVCACVRGSLVVRDRQRLDGERGPGLLPPPSDLFDRRRRPAIPGRRRCHGLRRRRQHLRRPAVGGVAGGGTRSLRPLSLSLSVSLPPPLSRSLARSCSLSLLLSLSPSLPPSPSLRPSPSLPPSLSLSPSLPPYPSPSLPPSLSSSLSSVHPLPLSFTPSLPHSPFSAPCLIFQRQGHPFVSVSFVSVSRMAQTGQEERGGWGRER